MRFNELSVGDTVCFPDLVGEAGYESWEVTGPHTCRRVNSSETQNVAGTERVAALITHADRQAAIRRYTESSLRELHRAGVAMGSTLTSAFAQLGDGPSTQD